MLAAIRDCLGMRRRAEPPQLSISAPRPGLRPLVLGTPRAPPMPPGVHVRTPVRTEGSPLQGAMPELIDRLRAAPTAHERRRALALSFQSTSGDSHAPLSPRSPAQSSDTHASSMPSVPEDIEEAEAYELPRLTRTQKGKGKGKGRAGPPAPEPLHLPEAVTDAPGPMRGSTPGSRASSSGSSSSSRYSTYYG